MGWWARSGLVLILLSPASAGAEEMRLYFPKPFKQQPAPAQTAPAPALASTRLLPGEHRYMPPTERAALAVKALAEGQKGVIAPLGDPTGGVQPLARLGYDPDWRLERRCPHGQSACAALTEPAGGAFIGGLGLAIPASRNVSLGALVGGALDAEGEASPEIKASLTVRY